MMVDIVEALKLDAAYLCWDTVMFQLLSSIGLCCLRYYNIPHVSQLSFLGRAVNISCHIDVLLMCIAEKHIALLFIAFIQNPCVTWFMFKYCQLCVQLDGLMG